MQLADIRTDTRYLISPQLTSTDYTDAALDRNVNHAYEKVLGWIVPIQGDWEIEGDIIYRDVATGVTDYEFPQQLLRVYKGEIMYETGGSYVPLDFISVQKYQNRVEGNSSRTFDDVQNPTAELFGNYLQVKPAGTEDVVNGIKLWVQLDFTTIDDTNDVPNLLGPVVRVLCLLAALDYAIAEEMDKKITILNKLIYGDPNKENDKGVKGEIEALYSIRSGARRDRLVAKRTSYR